MSTTGYIQVHAFTSEARFPLAGVAITITDATGSAIAMRLTNRSGTLDAPVEVSVPDRSASQTPDTGVTPYTRVNLYARLENYETIEVENLQIFPDTLTIQNLAMIPLAELPESWDRTEIFNTPTQNL